MKVVVAGSRHIDSYETVEFAIVASGVSSRITQIFSGGARGVDLSGEAWANRNNVPIARFVARWSRDGRRAGIVRNRLMADYADLLIAVWDGRSPGTRNMIEEMEIREKPAYIYRTDKGYGEWNQYAQKQGEEKAR